MALLSAINALREGVHSTNVPLYRYHSERAASYGLALVTYESGFGEQTPGGLSDEQRYTDFLKALQRRPEIYQLDRANIDAFKNAGGSLFMNFGIIGKPSKYGSWSALESIDQPTSPRYQALLDALSENSVPK